jgi:hypothetical protein
MQTCSTILSAPYGNGCIYGSANFATTKIVRYHFLYVKMKTKYNRYEEIQK